MFKTVGTTIAGAIVALSVAGPASATVVTDPANDFIASFGGKKSGDIDVLSAFATFNGSSFQIGGTMNGTIGTLPTSLYVFGVNRGAGTPGFASIGFPNIIFDAVITLTGTGVLGARDLVTNTAITLPAGSATISGSSFKIDVPLSALPSRGFTPSQYEFNLWPRDTAAAGAAAVSDFAPDTTNFLASSVAEPWSAVLLATSLGFLSLARRQRQS